MSQQSSANPAFLTRYTPEPEKPDTMTSDKQPPGVDEADDFPRSLEEALLGE